MSVAPGGGHRGEREASRAVAVRASQVCEWSSRREHDRPWTLLADRTRGVGWSGRAEGPRTRSSTHQPCPPRRRAQAVTGMSEISSWPGLLGRRRECATLSGVVAAVKAGRSQVLALRGEAGIGKTALLEFLLGRAPGCQVARAAGVESEMELPFAGLHQLCSPYADRLTRLPGPQRAALGTAFGLRPGTAPDRFLVGLAVLTLLSEVAEEQPLVCVLDDAQWLDRAPTRTLGSVARRLRVEPVAMVFGVRESADEPVLAGLPELVVHGLSSRDAGGLLDASVPGVLDPGVRDRIL